MHTGLVIFHHMGPRDPIYVAEYWAYFGIDGI